MTVSFADIVRLYDAVDGPAIPYDVHWATSATAWKIVVNYRRRRLLPNGRRVAYKHRMRARRMMRAERTPFVELTPLNWPPR